MFGVIEESLDTEKVKETELNQNAEIVAKNFNQICKICLNLNETNLIVVQTENELPEKVKYLFSDQSDKEKFDADMFNLICPNCEKNLDDFCEFKKQFSESLDILNAVRAKHTNRLEDKIESIKKDEDYSNNKPIIIDMSRLKRVLLDKTSEGGGSTAKKVCKESSSDNEM